MPFEYFSPVPTSMPSGSAPPLNLARSRWGSRAALRSSLGHISSGLIKVYKDYKSHVKGVRKWILILHNTYLNSILIIYTVFNIPQATICFRFCGLLKNPRSGTSKRLSSWGCPQCCGKGRSWSERRSILEHFDEWIGTEWQWKFTEYGSFWWLRGNGNSQNFDAFHGSFWWCLDMLRLVTMMSGLVMDRHGDGGCWVPCWPLKTFGGAVGNHDAMSFDGHTDDFLQGW